MICKICQSEAQSVFPADIRLYLNRPRSISAPPLNPAPEISVCLDCGYAEFVIAQWWLAAGWLAAMRPSGPVPSQAQSSVQEVSFQH